MENAIYLAGRVSRSFELRGYRDMLYDMGYIVTSRWLTRNVDHANREMTSRLARGGIAREDLHDIRTADIVCLFSEDRKHPSYLPGGGDGRLVEFGYAMGRHKKLWLCGPFENLFMCVPGVIAFKDWEELVPYAKSYIEEIKYAAEHPVRTRTLRDAPDAGTVRDV